MEATLLYLVLAILLFQLFILVVLSFKPTNTCCEDDCCCSRKKLCDCDDDIPMLDRPLTKKELKEMNMEEQNKEYNIMTARDMMTMKTEVSQTASPENMTKTFRGKSYKNKHNRDYINFLDEQERKAQKDYHNLKDSEPLEENDPNINKK